MMDVDLESLLDAEDVLPPPPSLVTLCCDVLLASGEPEHLELSLVRRRHRQLRDEARVGLLLPSSLPGPRVPRRPFRAELRRVLDEWRAGGTFPLEFTAQPFLHDIPVDMAPYQQLVMGTSVVPTGLPLPCIRRCLGLRTTDASVICLGPSYAQLTASFVVAHRPGGLLSVGARALAKHRGRCSSGWWGPCSGSDAAKNRQALNVLTRILNCAHWQNAYLLHADWPVYEVRVAEGYGARWSLDGRRFRGFLEPSAPDGHMKGWHH